MMQIEKVVDRKGILAQVLQQVRDREGTPWVRCPVTGGYQQKEKGGVPAVPVQFASRGLVPVWTRRIVRVLCRPSSWKIDFGNKQTATQEWLVSVA